MDFLTQTPPSCGVLSPVRRWAASLCPRARTRLHLWPYLVFTENEGTGLQGGQSERNVQGVVAKMAGGPVCIKDDLSEK